MPLALTGWEWGLLAAAAAFIVFALIVALVVPRSRPEFPSRYLGWFIAACIVFFAVQITAVLLLAEVGETHEAAAEGEHTETTETETTGTETTETETTGTGTTETETTGTGTTGTETAPPAGAAGDPAAGRQVFDDMGCAGCHTLADAGASGTIGPNLDEAMPPAELVVDRVTNGFGVMPSFSDRLTPEQIDDVAAYVSGAAGASG